MIEVAFYLADITEWSAVAAGDDRGAGLGVADYRVLAVHDAHQRKKLPAVGLYKEDVLIARVKKRDAFHAHGDFTDRATQQFKDKGLGRSPYDGLQYDELNPGENSPTVGSCAEFCSHRPDACAYDIVSLAYQLREIRRDDCGGQSRSRSEGDGDDD